jgi:hypothetical protein
MATYYAFTRARHRTLICLCKINLNITNHLRLVSATSRTIRHVNSDVIITDFNFMAPRSRSCEEDTLLSNFLPLLCPNILLSNLPSPTVNLCYCFKVASAFTMIQYMSNQSFFRRHTRTQDLRFLTALQQINVLVNAAHEELHIVL